MKKAGILLLIVAAAWVIIKVTPSPEPAGESGESEVITTLTGSTMGTTYTIRLADKLDPAQQEQWQQRIQQCLDDVNARMSTYRADSEISRFNRLSSKDWFSVSQDTARVVAAALEVAEQTQGAFDITVGPLVNLWSFGPERRPAGIPTDAEIDAARQRVGYQHLKVRLDPPALMKDFPELTVDLSGIAKGFAVDQVCRLFEEDGIAGYMVEVGGEIRTNGTKQDGQPWRIAVELPVAGQRLVQSVLELRDACLATSGDYRNFFEWDGQLYCHEIDPHTGRPIEHGVAEVSVLQAESAMRADAYATGLMIMPPDRAWQLAEKLGLEILIVTRDRQGYQMRVSHGFSETIVDDAKRGAE